MARPSELLRIIGQSPLLASSLMPPVFDDNPGRPDRQATTDNGLRGRRTARGVVYRKWRDSRRRRAEHDFFGLHTGLLSASGRPKPAYHTFKRVANKLTR